MILADRAKLGAEPAKRHTLFADLANPSPVA